MMTFLHVVAIVLLGLSAGLFTTFSYAVMPGLRRTGDTTFVETMRAINVAILNPALAVVLGGATIATGAALAATWDTDARGWLIAALVLHVLGAIAVTGAVNIPLNDALAAGQDGVGHLRAAFEDRWVAWNLVRSVLTVAAFACAVVGATRA